MYGCTHTTVTIGLVCAGPWLEGAQLMVTRGYCSWLGLSTLPRCQFAAAAALTDDGLSIMHILHHSHTSRHFHGPKIQKCIWVCYLVWLNTCMLEYILTQCTSPFFVVAFMNWSLHYGHVYVVYVTLFLSSTIILQYIYCKNTVKKSLKKMML